MVSLVTAYWMGLNAAESARVDRQMWRIASRATQRHVPAPVDDRPALINQIHQLQADLQQTQALLQQARAGWQQSEADGEECANLLLKEADAHHEVLTKLIAANAELFRLRWPDPF